MNAADVVLDRVGCDCEKIVCRTHARQVLAGNAPVWGGGFGRDKFVAHRMVIKIQEAAWEV